MELAYCIWNEAGGVGKTTFTANLAAAHSRNGKNVLAIDLDPQDAGLCELIGISHLKHTDGDHIGLHLSQRPQGDIHDLIHSTGEGFDVIPSHDRLIFLEESFTNLANDPMTNEEFNKNAQLRRILTESEIPQEYDILIIDPPASTSTVVENALYTARNVIAPAPFTPKGRSSLDGFNGMIQHYESQLDITINILSIIPNRVGTTNIEQECRAIIEDQDLPVAPVEFGERAALFNGAWDHHVSAFTYFEEIKDRQRSYEQDTIDKLETLAEYLETGGATTRESGEVSA